MITDVTTRCFFCMCDFLKSDTLVGVTNPVALRDFLLYILASNVQGTPHCRGHSYSSSTTPLLPPSPPLLTPQSAMHRFDPPRVIFCFSKFALNSAVSKTEISRLSQYLMNTNYFKTLSWYLYLSILCLHLCEIQHNSISRTFGASYKRHLHHHALRVQAYII